MTSLAVFLDVFALSGFRRKKSETILFEFFSSTAMSVEPLMQKFSTLILKSYELENSDMY